METSTTETSTVETSTTEPSTSGPVDTTSESEYGLFGFARVAFTLANGAQDVLRESSMFTGAIGNPCKSETMPVRVLLLFLCTVTSTW